MLQLEVTTRYVIIDSGTSPSAGPITDVKSIAVSLSSSNTISSQEYTFYCTYACNVAYTVGSCQLRAHRKDIVISISGGTCHVGMTAFDVPAPHGPSWISSDVLIETRQLEPKSPWHFHHEARHCRRQFCMQNFPFLAHFQAWFLALWLSVWKL